MNLENLSESLGLVICKVKPQKDFIAKNIAKKGTIDTTKTQSLYFL